MAYVAAIAAVVAVAISTYATVRQQQQQAEFADAEAKQKKFDAQAAADIAAFEEGQQRRRNMLMLGKEHAIQAAAGLETGSGTPLVNELDIVKQGELEALRIRQAGAQASGVKMWEARIAKWQASNARAAIPWTIAGGVLSAVSAGVGTYYNVSGYQSLTSKMATRQYTAGRGRGADSTAP